MPSFTQRLPNLKETGPIVEIILSPSITFIKSLNLKGKIPAIKLNSLIDTGATGTVIQQGISSQLKINPIGTTYITTPSSRNVRCLQYDVQLIFPNSVIVPTLIVTEAPLQGQHIQCLIGRALLSNAVLIYTGYDNSYTLSF
jgi:predicted aspartyl protease